MGGEQAASRARHRASATTSRPRARPGREVEEEEFKAPIREQYEDEGNPYYATARLWDDGIIAPRKRGACWRWLLRGAQCAGAGDAVRGVSDVAMEILINPIIAVFAILSASFAVSLAGLYFGYFLYIDPAFMPFFSVSDFTSQAVICCQFSDLFHCSSQ